MGCGLIGRGVAHSFSPQIHAMLGDYSYELWELPEEALGAFMQKRAFQGINVTIPYKQAVIPYCDELSPIAREIGAVNTIVNRNGRLIGHNTDYDGLRRLFRYGGIAPTGKKTLVLGGGGTSRTAMAVLEHAGARATVVSRKGPVTYDMLKERYGDTQIIVNTTPVGTYPANGETPVDSFLFPALCGVVDVVYHPLNSGLVLAARKRGVPAVGGLYMLVAQARKSAELFLNNAIPDSRLEEVHLALLQKRYNIVLVGMPGSGKTTIGKRLAAALSREFLDTDAMIEAALGEKIATYIPRMGEAAFRRAEAEAVREAGKRTGVVIATGGGAVLNPENYAPLKQNGAIYWIRRELSALSVVGRPLSLGKSMSELYADRGPNYVRFADRIVSNDRPLDDTVQELLEDFYESIRH